HDRRPPGLRNRGVAALLADGRRFQRRRFAATGDRTGRARLGPLRVLLRRRFLVGVLLVALLLVLLVGLLLLRELLVFEERFGCRVRPAHDGPGELVGAGEVEPTLRAGVVRQDATGNFGQSAVVRFRQDAARVVRG